MEIGELFFGKKHGKLAHLWNLAPKIICVFDMFVWAVTEGVHPLLEYMFFQTWYKSASDDPLPL